MKITSCLMMVLFVAIQAMGQNTFPSTGNVGINVTSGSATNKLHIGPNPQNWNGNELVITNSNGGIAISTISDQTLIHGDKSIALKPGHGKNAVMAHSSGKVGIGTLTPEYQLDVMGPAADWKGRFYGTDGYIMLGPINPSFAHIYTDRPQFIFNKDIWSYYGGFSSYSTYDLTLKTSGTPRLTVANSTGFVGISTAPSARLHLLESSGAWSDGIRLTLNNKHWDIVADTNGDRLVISKNQSMTDALVIHNGNVGIGSSLPNNKLTVNGTIYGKEVKVDLSVPGPDYVFEKEYDLRSLEDLRTYIELNKHLPEVPSAREMEANGIELSEMNMLLLKKVEELTLYLIEQDKKIVSMQREIEELRK